MSDAAAVLKQQRASWQQTVTSPPLVPLFVPALPCLPLRALTSVIPAALLCQMLRIKDPVKSLAFYRDVMGMTLIDKLEFPDMTFDLYFLTTLPAGETYPHTPGTDEAHKYLWTMKGSTLELTHNYGTESDPVRRRAWGLARFEQALVPRAP
jgi:hypothetical protein